MLVPILLSIAGLIVLLLVVAALQPTVFTVKRSATMEASPAAVFAQVNDFHCWEAWSPWAKMDPNAKNSFEGSAAGVGSMFSWSGNNKVDAGKMTILEATPAERVRIKLEFLRPMKCTNSAEFTLKPEAPRTHVTWEMTGNKNLMMKAFGLVMNMDKLVGRDFEKGLAAMATEAAKANG